MIRNGQHASWRRGREVLDDYDLERVLTEELADDLVNELVGLRPRRRRPAHAMGALLTTPPIGVLSEPSVGNPLPMRRPHLRVLRGGLVD